MIRFGMGVIPVRGNKSFTFSSLSARGGVDRLCNECAQFDKFFMSKSPYDILWSDVASAHNDTTLTKYDEF